MASDNLLIWFAVAGACLWIANKEDDQIQILGWIALLINGLTGVVVVDGVLSLFLGGLMMLISIYKLTMIFGGQYDAKHYY